MGALRTIQARDDAEGQAWLTERLALESTAASRASGAGNSISSPPTPRPAQDLDICQWQIGPNGTFRATSRACGELPAGVYGIEEDQRGFYFKQRTILSDAVVELPDTTSQRAVESIRDFRESRARYEAHGLLYRRGLLFYGPQGSGKTVAVQLLSRDLIAGGGIVLYCENPHLMVEAIGAVRVVERTRSLNVVMEDIDELIERYGEHNILALLDGEHRTDNVVFLASTNYPERLGARIINRPSRFDERIYVGMPGKETRLRYLQQTTDVSAIGETQLRRWAADTDGLSIAHLRELVAAVLCLRQDYDDVLGRLRSMMDMPREESGWRKKAIGMVTGLAPA